MGDKRDRPVSAVGRAIVDAVGKSIKCVQEADKQRIAELESQLAELREAAKGCCDSWFDNDESWFDKDDDTLHDRKIMELRKALTKSEVSNDK